MTHKLILHETLDKCLKNKNNKHKVVPMDLQFSRSKSQVKGLVCSKNDKMSSILQYFHPLITFVVLLSTTFGKKDILKVGGGVTK